MSTPLKTFVIHYTCIITNYTQLKKYINNLQLGYFKGKKTPKDEINKIFRSNNTQYGIHITHKLLHVLCIRIDLKIKVQRYHFLISPPVF